MLLVIAVVAVARAFPRSLTFLGLPSGAIGSVLAASMLAMFVAGLAAQVYRYGVVSGPVERQQTKWVVLAFGAHALDEIVFYALLLYPPIQRPGLPHALHSLVGGTLNVAFLTLEPVVLTIAILRYRLWDVDLLIRRTLIYGALTSVLAVVYLAAVVVLQTMFTALTGAQRSELVTVLSTLTIAALFVPLRHRLQAFIDRRFYRQRYDATRILAGFAAAIRDDATADLDELTGRLVTVVEEALRPNQVSLWVKPIGGLAASDGPPERRAGQPAGASGMAGQVASGGSPNCSQ
jgi:hypothetical protein